ncbi:hypothetical protein PVAND_017435 [Polypedilum vanderplanki]|uniref:Uncharacterized protein n=1 Tax=Polypedilum vanderplanki TaxID=319348 RepID=A0A9J6BI99_POLVA|nr:hypothetical protein PVAND_017435 [Polypedilum vanderplanki]
MTKTISFAIFIAVILFVDVKSFNINCNYTGVIFGFDDWSTVGTFYECQTTNIPTSSGITVTNVTGKLDPGKNYNDVDSININGNWTLSFIPRGLSETFPNIKVFKIYFTTIDTFYGDEFNEFSELEWLVFANSNLTTISSRLFEKTPKIHLIHFSSTMIKRVGYDLFTPLNVTQLKHVTFEYATCINRRVNGNQTAIISLINELREKCSFDNEFPTTTCSDKIIEELVCDLKDKVAEIQEDLMTKDERMEKFELELKLKDEKIEEMKLEFEEAYKVLQKRILWLENEVLILSAHPCAC